MADETKWRCPRCTMTFYRSRPAGAHGLEITTCAERGCSVRFGHGIREKGRVGGGTKPVRVWLEPHVGPEA